MWLKSRLCVFISIHGHRHAHLFLSVVLFLVSLYFVLKSFFHLFLIPAVVPDENSMEDPLCNSSFGSMVSLDYVTPDTETKPYKSELLSQEEVESRGFVWNGNSSDLSSHDELPEASKYLADFSWRHKADVGITHPEKIALSSSFLSRPIQPSRSRILALV